MEKSERKSRGCSTLSEEIAHSIVYHHLSQFSVDIQVSGRQQAVWVENPTDAPALPPQLIKQCPFGRYFAAFSTKESMLR